MPGGFHCIQRPVLEVFTDQYITKDGDGNTFVFFTLSVLIDGTGSGATVT